MMSVCLFSSSNIFFAVTRCVIVVHEIYAEVYHNSGIKNMHEIAKFFFWLHVAMHKLKVAKVTSVKNFYTGAAKVALY
jgi:hypothetical protein